MARKTFLSGGVFVSMFLAGCGGSSSVNTADSDAKSDSPLADTAHDMSDGVSVTDSNVATDSVVDSIGDSVGETSGLDASDATPIDGGQDVATETGLDSTPDSVATEVASDTTASDTQASDTTASDSAPADTIADTSPLDSGNDATTCTASGNACGAGGICYGTTCGTCASDAACVTAYGSGVLCLTVAGNNVCVPAQCRTNTDCTGGQLCQNNECVACTASSQCAGYGAATSYVCANGGCIAGNCATSADCAGANSGEVCISNNCTACSSDADCSSDKYYSSQAPAKTFCDTNAAGTTHGQCIAGNSCATGTNPPSCADASHTCCNSGTAGLTCISGSTYDTTPGVGQSCCTNTDCPTTGGYYCSSNQCKTCPAATTDFYVNPSAGSDTTGTGSNGSTTCELKTVTQALKLVGTPSAPVTIHVLGNISTATGEVFPLVVPSNVTIQSDSGNISVTGSAAATNLFNTTGSVTLKNLSLTGAFSYGVNATSGTLTASNVSITSANAAAGRGVNLAGAVANLSNLTVTSGQYGIYESGAASVNLAATTVINGSHFGVYITGNAGLTINVTPTASPYTNTPVLIENTNVGLVDDQTPDSGANLPVTVTGLVVLNSVAAGGAAGTTGYNIIVYGGSNFVMRNSVTLGAAQSGILVTANTTAGLAVGVANDISHIDLGNTTSMGHNVLQAVAAGGVNYNRGVGLCLATRDTNADLLVAIGNSFVTAAATPANVDCSTATSAIISATGGCAPNGTNRALAYAAVAGGGGGTVADAANISFCTPN